MEIASHEAGRMFEYQRCLIKNGLLEQLCLKSTVTAYQVPIYHQEQQKTLMIISCFLS